MIVATAGHIDHGKTVLVQALTGVDTDRLPEEKARGLSIDLGFAYQRLESGIDIGFVDVPGHERFVRNMLAGVTGIDFALLVVAADDGPMPQTEEHLAILDLLGVSNGAIALTKTDRVDEDRLLEAMDEIAILVEGTVMEGAQVYPCSGITGEGIDALKTRLHSEAEACAGEAARGHFRLAIDRTFTLSGAGLVVTGTVFSGRVAVGDRLLLSPQGLPVRIRSIHAQNRESETGETGQRCALNLTGAGIDRASANRGDWVLAEQVHAPTDRIDASVRILVAESRPLRHWTPVHLHIGARDVTARVAMLEDWQIAPGQRGLVQLVLDEPVGALWGDRLILRDQSAQRTIAGGMVVDPYSPRRGRRRPERVRHVQAMALSKVDEALGALLEAHPEGVDLDRFAQVRNLLSDEAEALWRRTDMVRIGRSDHAIGVALDAWKDVKQAVVEGLREWHRKWPARPGPEDERLRRSLAKSVTPELLNAVLLDLIKAGQVIRSGAGVNLPGHRPEFEGKDAALWDQLSHLLESDDLRPPRTRELASETGVDLKAIEGLLNRAAGMGLVHRVADNRYFLPDTLLELARIAERIAAKSNDGSFDAKKYRDATEIGRNVAIEVLEYFDKQKFCRRVGDKRIVERSARDVFGS